MEITSLVSVVIPCYNQAQYLTETVESVIAQTYKNIEIIIINDGSSDNTEDIALSLKNKFNSKIKYIYQENRGVSTARNVAIDSAKGIYILPLDADDTIDKNMVLECVNTINNSKFDIIYCHIQCFGDDNRIVRKNPFSENNILYENPIGISSLYSKDVWEAIGGYKSNMSEGYEDWEFWITAYEKGFKFELLNKILMNYRVKSISRDTKAVE